MYEGFYYILRRHSYEVVERFVSGEIYLVRGVESLVGTIWCNVLYMRDSERGGRLVYAYGVYRWVYW